MNDFNSAEKAHVTMKSARSKTISQCSDAVRWFCRLVWQQMRVYQSVSKK